MLSDKGLIETTERLIRESPEVFDALLEFERTKRVPKFTYKKRVNFTIDSELFRKFQSYCEDKRIKMSTKVEELIREEIKKFKKRTW